MKVSGIDLSWQCLWLIIFTCLYHFPSFLLFKWMKSLVEKLKKITKKKEEERRSLHCSWVKKRITTLGNDYCRKRIVGSMSSFTFRICKFVASPSLFSTFFRWIHAWVVPLKIISRNVQGTKSGQIIFLGPFL